MRASALWALASATRLARTWAYSFWRNVSQGSLCTVKTGATYGLVLDLLGLAPLEGGTVALVLETLGGDQPLDAGGLGVGGLALTLGLDLSSDNVLADLGSPATLVSFIFEYCIQLAPLS